MTNSSIIGQSERNISEYLYRDIALYAKYVVFQQLSLLAALFYYMIEDLYLCIQNMIGHSVNIFKQTETLKAIIL